MRYINIYKEGRANYFMSDRLRMTYVETKLIPWEELYARACLPCAEVPNRGGEYGMYPHKPIVLRSQMPKSQDRRSSDAESPLAQ